MIENSAYFDFTDVNVIFSESKFININEDWDCIGVSSDSRTIQKGNIFIALKGENFDGHEKVIESLEKGANAAIVSSDWYQSNSNIDKLSLIVVDDTLKALGMLAKYHRRRFVNPVIAVAGSNGKTTTKEMISNVLSQKFRVLKTFENFNNQVGTPFTILQLNDDFDTAVIEIGTNEPGEISILSDILQPTHGIITNIGKEHLEKLINLDGVELEETFLFGYLMKNNGFSFINFDDNRLKRYSLVLEKRLTFGIDENADIKATISYSDKLNPIIKFNYQDREFTTQLETTGYTTALNAIAAASVGFHFGLSNNEIKNGLETFQIHEGHGYGRMYIQKTKWGTLINDCYNANPESMKAALFVLKNMNSDSNKIAILGDMRELGEYSASEHIELLNITKDSCDYAYIIGNEMEKAFSTLNEVNSIKHYKNKTDLIADLRNIISEGDIILVKGSRGMKMEEIIKEII